MSFFSTRGGSGVTASQAVLRGLAPGGGLYVPAFFPQISMRQIVALAGMPYDERAAFVLSLFLEDYTREEIAAATRAAYARFSHPEVAPVRTLSDNTHVLELFHGPTLAFKDVALTLLPHLTTLAARKNGETREVAILVATSGDTGKAALEGFLDVPGTSCTVFYPLGGVSRVQELQMVTTGGDNTHVIGVRGNFDDAQTGVKRLFADEAFNRRVGEKGRVLSSANSINFGRLAPQVTYYFSAYADLVARGAVAPGERVHFVVPTGNFGNILAGYYAARMGLPVGRLLCASNANNVLADFLRTGRYDTHRTFLKTISPSMDILVSSNLERLLFESCGRNGRVVCEWMRTLRENGSFDIGAQRLDALNRQFTGDFATEDQTRKAIARMFARHHYLTDPHTAVGAHVLEAYRERTGDRASAVLVATASPYKFCADVLEALGVAAPDRGDPVACAQLLGERTGTPVPASVLRLPTLPIRHRAACDVPGMDAAVLEALS